MKKLKHFEIGAKVSHLTVVGSPVIFNLSYSHSYKYLCRCACGKELYVSRSNLIQAGPNKSCGCKTKNRAEHFPIGTKIGNLTVVGEPTTIQSAQGQPVWYYPCRCICGKEFEVARSSLLTCGPTKSCGCVTWKNNTKHGDVDTRLYSIWKAMRRRCGTPTNDHYQYYGGKGIAVCPEWNEFINFKQWALLNGYTDKLTIDRLDSNKNYEPLNCRWITRSENSRRTNTENFYLLPIKDI